MALQQTHQQAWNKGLRRSLKCGTSGFIGFVLVLVLAAAPGLAQETPQFPILNDHLPGFEQERSPSLSPPKGVGLRSPQEY